MRHFRWLLLLGASMAGCAYYNGLYNANLLVREARKAEREGRVGEARSMWSQVVVKVDTVLARYPDSEYRDDALYLKGLALSEIGGCRAAFDPLRLVVDSSPDANLVADSRLTMGRCMLEVERYDSVLHYLQPLIEDGSERGDAALWMTGRAYHHLRNDQMARRFLEASGSESAGFDLALVHLSMGDPAAAREVLAGIPSTRYPEHQWRQVLDTLGLQDPATANDIALVLVERRDLTRGQRARLLIAAGKRSEFDDPSSAADYYARAVSLAGDSVEAKIAGARLALTELRGAVDLTVIPALVARLNQVSADGGIAAGLAGPALNALNAYLADTLGGPFADLRSFIVAEMVRDSAGAAHLAGIIFARIASDFQTSVIAPKALIAAHASGRLVDDLVGLLNDRYPHSPYTLALQGIDSPRFSIVEDSLSRIPTAGRQRTLRDRGVGVEADEGEIIN